MIRVDVEEKVVHLDALRLDRNKPRQCTCDPHNRRYVIDTTNKQVECGCGLRVDPYEAMEDLAKRHQRLNEQQDQMYAQREQWMKEKPHSVLFKRLEREYRRGEMLPTCPECGQTFDYKNITGNTNAQFYYMQKAKQQEKSAQESVDKYK